MGLENDLENFSIGKLFKWGIIVMLIVGAFGIIGNIFGLFTGAVQEATQVAKTEFGPKASLKKYEWFKDASEQIKKLDRDIAVYESKSNTLCVSGMDRLAREQCMLWAQEVAGIKSAHNDVVAEYNAQSNKFNWSMYNVDDIPTMYKER